MLKQDVLDCVHSKVRWYAIHQTKKVCFRLNPHLYGTEDLQGAVNELQYVPDYNETRRLESEVYGENYGRKYPAFTVREMKEYKFWPFVAGRDWRKCSSLRITPGSLLSSLVETYREMEKEGKILQYTTDVYENAVTYKPKGCLKNSTCSTAPMPSSYQSSDSTDAGINEDAAAVIKISFTYYGVSISHLKKILKHAGVENVTEADIVSQNPKFFGRNSEPFGGIQRLKNLVTKKSALHLVASSINLEQGPTPVEEMVHFDHHMRRISKKKFTQGQMCWITRHAARFPCFDHTNTILNPINRRIMLEKKQELRMRKTRRAELHESINKAIKESSNAYEKWWLRQMEDPLMATYSVFTPSHLTFFGNSWIIDGNLSTEDGHEIKHKPVAADEKNQTFAPVFNGRTADSCRPPMVVKNFDAVDTWKCECDVCTGSLFRQIGNVTCRTEVGHLEEEVEAAPVENLRRRTVTAIPKKAKKPKGKKKKGKKGKKEKPKYDPKIWWNTVSTYTTPKWRTQQDIERLQAKAKSPTKPEKSPLLRKINKTYSFDRLRGRRPSINHETKAAVSNGIGDFSKQSSKGGSTPETEERKSEIAKLSEKISRDHLNTEGLLAHNILYKHKIQESKSHIKIKLPALDLPLFKTPSPRKMTAFRPTEEGDRIFSSTPLPTNKGLFSDSRSCQCSDNDSCKVWISSDKTSVTSKPERKCRDDYYFLHYVPENFPELCLAGLNEFIVRFEVVLTGNGFHRVESLTVNRMPLCSYSTRERGHKTTREENGVSSPK